MPRAAATAGAFAVYAVPQCLSTAPPLHAQPPFPLAPIDPAYVARRRCTLSDSSRPTDARACVVAAGGSWCCTVALDRTMPLCHGHAARHAQVKSCAPIACGCAHSVCARSRQRVGAVSRTPCHICAGTGCIRAVGPSEWVVVLSPFCAAPSPLAQPMVDARVNHRPGHGVGSGAASSAGSHGPSPHGTPKTAVPIRVFNTSEFPPLGSASKDVSRSPLTGSVKSDNSLPSQACGQTHNPRPLTRRALACEPRNSPEADAEHEDGYLPLAQPFVAPRRFMQPCYLSFQWFSACRWSQRIRRTVCDGGGVHRRCGSVGQDSPRSTLSQLTRSSAKSAPEVLPSVSR